jgi:hypothetical protein
MEGKRLNRDSPMSGFSYSGIRLPMNKFNQFMRFATR